LGFNPITIIKKHGTIRVFIDFKDLNKACPKDNYPTPFIDACANHEALSLMDGFSGYNHIQIRHTD